MIRKNEKDLKLEPVDLRIDRHILIDSINNNTMDWQINKTIEECVELMDVLIHYKREERANEQVCQEIGDMAIQIGILQHLFSKEMTQKCINRKLISIDNRNQRLINYKHREVGFKP